MGRRSEFRAKNFLPFRSEIDQQVAAEKAGTVL
jgi:hypothetical protein